MQNEVGACLFPVLTDGTFNERTGSTLDPQQSTPIDLGSLRTAEKLRSFCAEQNISPASSLSSLFSTTWALVLGRYLDLETVGFVALAGTEAEDLQGVCAANLDKSKSLVESLRQVDQHLKSSFNSYRSNSSSAHPLLDSKDKQFLFNTVVVIEYCDGIRPELRVDSVGPL